jgi:hypothetical protein
MPSLDLDHLLCRLWFPTMADVRALGKAFREPLRPVGSIQARRGWLYRHLRENHKWSAWDLLLCETLSPVSVRRLLTSTLWRGGAHCYVAGDDGRLEAERMAASGLRAPLGRMLQNSAEGRWEQVEVEISRVRSLLEVCAPSSEAPCLRPEWATFQASLDAYLGSNATGTHRRRSP